MQNSNEGAKGAKEKMDVTQKLTEIIQTIKTATYQKRNEWQQYSYRKMSATFKVPYNDVKLITTQLRSHPNIDYRYVPTEARYRPIKYRYIDFSENSIILDKFQQLTQKEFTYVTNRLAEQFPGEITETSWQTRMILLVMVEEMKHDGFLEEWTPARIGNIVRYTGWDYREVEEALDILCQAHILKQLGASASYRMALSEEDYAKLDDSSYAEQFRIVLENSQAVVNKTTNGQEFQILTELNEIAQNIREFIAFNSEMGSKLLKQQKLLATLQGKEDVYAGTMVKMEAISRTYNDTVKENEELKKELALQKQKQKAYDRFYADQKKKTTEELDAMSASLISELESYFSRSVREKNQPAITNRTKSELIRIVFATIDNIKKGNAE